MQRRGVVYPHLGGGNRVWKQGTPVPCTPPAHFVAFIVFHAGSGADWTRKVYCALRTDRSDIFGYALLAFGWTGTNAPKITEISERTLLRVFMVKPSYHGEAGVVCQR